MNGVLNETFGISKDLKHGDLVLCNIVLEYSIRIANINTTSTLINRSSQVVGYTDDVNNMNIMATSIFKFRKVLTA